MIFELNIFAIILATLAQFAIGAFWYTVLFGKLWGQIHGFDKLPKATQDKMVKEMGPFYGIQLVVTIVTTVVLALLMSSLPEIGNPYVLAALLWLGFVVPTQVSAVIFGGTEPKWIVKKIAVQAGAAFFYLQSAASILALFA